MIEEADGRAHVCPADLSNVDEIKSLVDTISRETKKIDILANVAGVWHGVDDVYAGKDFQTFSQKVILDTFMVGTIAPTLLVHGLLPLMAKNAKIINISGTFENGAKGWLPYFVSKRAIEDLTIGLAAELKDKEIQVNGISPSDTATEAYCKFFPQYIPEAIEPVEIAKFAVTLCLEENKTTGQIFVIKKGEKPFLGYHS